MTGAAGERPNDAPEPGDPAAAAAHAVPGWLADVAPGEAATLVAVRRREAAHGAGPPAGEALLAMEEPLQRLTGAAMLLRDLALAAAEGADAPRAPGLVFLAAAMEREATLAYRLYHGRHPMG